MRFSALAFLAIAPLLLSSATSAHATTLQQSSATLNGIRLTLSVPRQTYAQGALVRLTVEVTNTGKTPVTEKLSCRQENPRVLILSQTNTTLYPPAVPPFVSTDCPTAGLPTVFRPGFHEVTHPYAILRGSRVAAAITLARLSSRNSKGETFTVQTPALHLTLTKRAYPVLGSCGANRFCALIRPAGPVQGPLLYSYTAKCKFGGVTRYVQHTYFSPARQASGVRPPANRLLPGCGHPLAWRFAAGWLGSPAVVGHFGS